MTNPIPLCRILLVYACPMKCISSLFRYYDSVKQKQMQKTAIAVMLKMMKARDHEQICQCVKSFKPIYLQLTNFYVYSLVLTFLVQQTKNNNNMIGKNTALVLHSTDLL